MQKIKCLCGVLIHGLCSTCTDWWIHHVMLCWRKILFYVCIGPSFTKHKSIWGIWWGPLCIKVKKLLHSLGQTKFSAQACLHIMRGKHENQVCEWTIQRWSQKLWKLWPLELRLKAAVCVVSEVHAGGCANHQITPIRYKWFRLQG